MTTAPDVLNPLAQTACCVCDCHGITPAFIAAPQMLQDERMRLALVNRDIGAIYRLLQRNGISQRRIAAMVEQSEISETLSGRRVTSYDVLLRICRKLGDPRGYMGLAYDPLTEEWLAGNQ